jgi:phosphohistidine phosphatase SixA
MAMKFLLLRHAESLSRQAARARFDADRPLSMRGREQAKQVGQMLLAYGCLPHPIVCSPFVRTQETAAIVNQQLPAPVPLLPLTILAPGCGSDELLRAALNYGDATNRWLLAVLHEPDLSLILGTWLNGGGSYPLVVHEGDLFVVRTQFARGQARGELLAYYSPLQLSRD